MGIGRGGFQEADQLPMSQEFTKYQGHVNNPKRTASPPRALRPRDLASGRTSSTFRATTSTADRLQIPKPIRSSAVPAARKFESGGRAAATAKAPLILAAGGVVMGDAVEEGQHRPSACARRL